jgi:hypothetical protein
MVLLSVQQLSSFQVRFWFRGHKSSDASALDVNGHLPTILSVSLLPLRDQLS